VVALLSLTSAALTAQTQATAAPAATRAFTSEVGFSYVFPADWEVTDMSQALAARQQAQQAATTDIAKRGAVCTQIALSARHGSPTSTIAAAGASLSSVTRPCSSVVSAGLEDPP